MSTEEAALAALVILGTGIVGIAVGNRASVTRRDSIPIPNLRETALQWQLTRVRESLVIAISFLRRDVGTPRLAHTIEQLLTMLCAADQDIQSTLGGTTPIYRADYEMNDIVRRARRMAMRIEPVEAPYSWERDNSDAARMIRELADFIERRWYLPPTKQDAES